MSSYKSFVKRLEKAIAICKYLPKDNAYRKRIDRAIEEVAEDPYFDIIGLRYWEGKTLEEMGEYFDCNYQTVAKHKDRLLEKMLKVVFPEEYIKNVFENDQED